MTGKKISFDGKILMLGYGSVGQCALPILIRHINVDLKNITVLEADDKQELFEQTCGHLDINYVVERVTKANYKEVLSKYLGPGDYLIDLSVDIDGIETADWCAKNDVMYINTSIENWPGEYQDEHFNYCQRTLYTSHQRMRQVAADWEKDSATCIVTHGANPGLVSHFTKAAILDIADHLDLEERNYPVTKGDWAKLLQATGTKVIHISERDTQISDLPKEQDEFVNTWSVEGFWAEGIAPAELGWGTHECKLPEGGHMYEFGPKNAIYLDRPGAATLVRSWVPLGGDIIGFCIQHSEAITISDFFTVLDPHDGTPLYRPTVHYAYHPCDAAVVSMHELRMREWKLQPRQRIMNNEITSGIDELGVLLLGPSVGWWYGSQLSIEETRELVNDQNATTLQVVASLLGAIVWAINNPRMGYNEPEDLPHEEILATAKPYLGPIASVSTDWTPLKNRSPLYSEKAESHTWQFDNFLVK